MLFLTSDLSTRCCFCRAQEERCAALAAETNRTTLGENDQVDRAGKKLVVPFRMMLILVVTLVILQYMRRRIHTMYIIYNKLYHYTILPVEFQKHDNNGVHHAVVALEPMAVRLAVGQCFALCVSAT